MTGSFTNQKEEVQVTFEETSFGYCGNDEWFFTFFFFFFHSSMKATNKDATLLLRDSETIANKARD